MSSVFPVNATLTFHLPTGQVITDPETGNVTPILGDLVVEAYLKPDGVQANRAVNDTSPGQQTPSEVMSGRMVNPQFLPPSISDLTQADAIIGGRTGKFLIRVPTQSAWGDREILGDKIYGSFTLVKGASGTTPSEPPPIESGIVAGTNLSALRVAAVVNGELFYADHRIEAHAYTIAGLVRAAVAVGQSPVLLGEGVVSDNSWAWQVGQPIFLGKDGYLTQDANSIDTGFLLNLGRVLKPTQIYFDIDEEATFL